MFNCPECSANYNTNEELAFHYKVEHAPATPNDDTTPPLNNFEVNQYVLSIAIEIVKTGNYVLSEACEQVRAQLRRDAFTGEILNND